MTVAALAWYEASVNALAFLSLSVLAYVLPRILRETIGARLPLMVASTAWLATGALSRINLATDAPVSWWPDVTTYVQPFMATAFLGFLAADYARAVRLRKEALELIYADLGDEAGDHVAATLRAIR